MDPRTLIQARKCVKALKLALFGLSSQPSLDALDRLSRAQVEKYGHLGLRAVPVAQMPTAVDELFAQLDLRPGQRLVEVGPGPHGGIGLIAALMGLESIIVEYDQTFEVDVDLLKQQLALSPGTELALSQIAGLRGSVSVSQIENLNRAIQPYRQLIDAAAGSIRVIPGDFADRQVQEQLADAQPIDHVVCTDAISPLNSAHSTTTAMMTTGGDERTQSMLSGLAKAAAHARTLYIGLVVPEQSEDFQAQIARMYAFLEASLREQGRSIRHDQVISPSSASLLRARLYHLSS